MANGADIFVSTDVILINTGLPNVANVSVAVTREKYLHLLFSTLMIARHLNNNNDDELGWVLLCHNYSLIRICFEISCGGLQKGHRRL